MSFAYMFVPLSGTYANNRHKRKNTRFSTSFHVKFKKHIKNTTSDYFFTGCIFNNIGSSSKQCEAIFELN